MNEEQQEELLIRIDERTETICKWIQTHVEVHKEEKSQLRKYIYLIYSALVGVIIKVVFWN